MPSRREFLGGGVGALALGLLGRTGFRAPSTGPGRSSLWLPTTSPIRRLPPAPPSVSVDGLPFDPWFTGDSFKNTSIPFHVTADATPPVPGEEVDVAVVGGGISGLSAAYLLRDHAPVVFDLRERFGGTSAGESWEGVTYSLGGAYVITPDAGSFLDHLYRELGLDRVRRESFPPDPIELYGRIREDFWSGAAAPADQLRAFQRYAEVVTTMAERAYPEIPLSADPAAARAVIDLDTRSFRQDLEQQMGLPLPPLLAAAVQAYFYSSFCAGIDEISAAAGWNFVAAEEYGRWVFPGGNAYMVWSMWDRLRRTQPAGPRRLRAGCRVFAVRLSGERVLVSYLDPAGEAHSLTARHVIMAGSKEIAKHVLHDLPHLDPEKLQAMQEIHSGSYLVVNVLLDLPPEQDFYDLFLVGDETFPMTPAQGRAARKVIDVIRGDYARPGLSPRGVLTFFWPLPWEGARADLIAADVWPVFARALVPQLRSILSLLGLAESAVRQVRMTRWGHAMPLARVGFIADGFAERVRRPLEGRIHFVNQDNWALPAVENSVLDARATAEAIRRDLTR